MRSFRFERLARLHSICERTDRDAHAQDSLVLALTTDPCEVVRHEAAFLLGDLKRQSRLHNEKAVLTVLSKAAGDKSVLVRHEIALTLAKFCSRSATETLRVMTSDYSHEVVESALYALEEARETGNTHVPGTKIPKNYL